MASVLSLEEKKSVKKDNSGLENSWCMEGWIWDMDYYQGYEVIKYCWRSIAAKDKGIDYDPEFA